MFFIVSGEYNSTQLQTPVFKQLSLTILNWSTVGQEIFTDNNFSLNSRLGFHQENIICEIINATLRTCHIARVHENLTSELFC